MMALCAPVFVCLFVFLHCQTAFSISYFADEERIAQGSSYSILWLAPWVVTSEKSAMIFQLMPKSTNFVTLVLAAGHVRSMTKCISDVRKVNPLILV